jgi:hypothetical protein
VSPFAKNWPEALRNWTSENIEKMCPLLPLLEKPRIVIDDKVFSRVHVKGLGYRKSKDNPECPFLLTDPGDGTRPCGLVGTSKEYAFESWCKDEPTFPRDKKFVKEWQWRYPDCSYTWIEE